MFSGIVEERAEVVSLRDSGGLGLLCIKSTLDHSATKIGDSIAIDGVCLTAIENKAGLLSFDVSPETLRRSTLGKLQSGDWVNLERSLEFGGRMHGHIVAGHVDAVVPLLERRPEAGSVRLNWGLPKELRAYVAPKASISLAGVSLTVGELRANSFSVYAIPHTLEQTTLSTLNPGAKVNIEVDLLARYVHSCLFAEASRKQESAVTSDFLKEHGFVD